MSKQKTNKDILSNLRTSFPRIDFDGGLYFKICSEAYSVVEKDRPQVEKLYNRQPTDGKLFRFGRGEKALFDKIRRQESVIITFAAMCLEACIWDYAACNTSQNKTEENFGSLNLVAKWVVIPQLLCGSDITKVRVNDTCLLGRLRDLKNARNDLVHPKSRPLPNDYNEALKELIPQKRQTAVEDAFGLIGLLLGELEKVDKSMWWFFQTNTYRFNIKKDYRRPPRVHSDMDNPQKVS